MAAIQAKAPGKWRREAQAARTAYAYIVPAAVIMGIITLFPLLYQLWMSATDYSNLNLRTPSLFGQIWGTVDTSIAEEYNSPNLLGLDNYGLVVLNTLGTILSGFDFWRILLFNLVWTFTQVALHVGIGVAVAMLLNANGLWLKKFYRAMYIFYQKHYAQTTPLLLRPAIVSGIVVQGSWALLRNALRPAVSRRVS